jgi:hypothetical protein
VDRALVCHLGDPGSNLGQANFLQWLMASIVHEFEHPPGRQEKIYIQKHMHMVLCIGLIDTYISTARSLYLCIFLLTNILQQYTAVSWLYVHHILHLFVNIHICHLHIYPFLI